MLGTTLTFSNFISWFLFSESFFVFFAIIIQFLTILLSVALFTVWERKIMAALQKRKGPNVHGFLGSLQSIADGLKLALKEDVAPHIANISLFRSAPHVALFFAYFFWSSFPFTLLSGIIPYELSLLVILPISSLLVYTLILGGWSSNSIYSFLGSIRSAAQMISYEICIAFCLLMIIFVYQTLNAASVLTFQESLIIAAPYFFITLPLLVVIMAESARPPFDLPEAEAELVSGYHVEYSGMPFSAFFLAEYGAYLFMLTFIIYVFIITWIPIFPYFVGISEEPGYLLILQSELEYNYMISILIEEFEAFKTTSDFSSLTYDFTKTVWFSDIEKPLSLNLLQKFREDRIASESLDLMYEIFTLSYFLWLSLIVGTFLFFFTWLKISVPRYRYDQLMVLCWGFFIPYFFLNYENLAILIYSLDDVVNFLIEHGVLK